VSKRELPAQKSKLSVLAASTDLNKKQRNTLYAAARKQFSLSSLQEHAGVLDAYHLC